MKRGLAGLIAVLLLAALVAVGRVGPSSTLSAGDPGGSTSTSESAAAAAQVDSTTSTSSTGAAHDHSTHDHGTGKVGGGKASKAAAGGSSAASEVVIAEDAKTKVLAAGTGACGAERTVVDKATGRTMGCTHVDDLLPTKTTHASVTRTAPTCYGNGTSGQRIQLVYAYPDGQPDRTAEVAGHILEQVVPAMDGYMRTQSKAAGRELGFRFYMPGCELKLYTLKVDKAAAQKRDVGLQGAAVDRALHQSGLFDDSRKYLVWMDASANGAAGVNFGSSITDDNPTPLNIYNGTIPGAHTELGSYLAITFENFFGVGPSGADVEIHELLHAMGAVQPSAPNYRPEVGGGRHCSDGEDVMCNSRDRYALFSYCHGPVLYLDCNNDDYFNPKPAAGSYLSTHWNLANSWYLSGRPVPDLPI